MVSHDEQPPYTAVDTNHFSRQIFLFHQLIIFLEEGGTVDVKDPRVTLLGDTVYMLYTAFDGWGSLRIALTSIKLDDFEKKSGLEKSGFISHRTKFIKIGFVS